MPVLGILLLAAVGVAVVVGAPLEVGFGTVVAFWLLVPGNLVVVGLPHIVLVDRLVLYAFALRLVLRHGQRGEPPGSAFRLTAVHAALAAVLVVGYVDGVVVAQRGLSLASDLDTWLYTLDVVVVFVAGLAVIRTVGPRRVVSTIVGVAALSAVIGIIERFTGSGWSNFFFEHVPATYKAPGAGGLQTRAGHVRSQGASQFALEYGWVLTMLLPLTVVTAFRWARGPARLARAAYLLPVLVAVSVALAASRSAELAVAVGGLLVTVLAGFPRRLITAMAVAAAVVALIAVTDPSLIGASFTSASHTNSISVRLQRLPDVFALVVQRPFTGIGYSGVTSTVPGLDDAYALLYVTVGVIGLAAWVALLVTAGVTSLRSLAAPRNTWMRDLGAATVVGIVAVA
ncbi:MAG TPA: O-antigen ligase family protein, partial [Acidimicrobiales bacterium]|nr:O-antigen ligase family protein [Acidimicrobiales bacterium]